MHDRALRSWQAQRQRDYHRCRVRTVRRQIASMRQWAERWEDSAPDKSAGMYRAALSCEPVAYRHWQAYVASLVTLVAIEQEA
jgi:hypothetical protein